MNIIKKDTLKHIVDYVVNWTHAIANAVSSYCRWIKKNIDKGKIVVHIHWVNKSMFQIFHGNLKLIFYFIQDALAMNVANPNLQLCWVDPKIVLPHRCQILRQTGSKHVVMHHTIQLLTHQIWKLNVVYSHSNIILSLLGWNYRRCIYGRVRDPAHRRQTRTRNSKYGARSIKWCRWIQGFVKHNA